jgi:hypothetical protein
MHGGILNCRMSTQAYAKFRKINLGSAFKKTEILGGKNVFYVTYDSINVHTISTRQMTGQMMMVLLSFIL